MAAAGVDSSHHGQQPDQQQQHAGAEGSLPGSPAAGDADQASTSLQQPPEQQARTDASPAGDPAGGSQLQAAGSGDGQQLEEAPEVPRISELDVKHMMQRHHSRLTGNGTELDITAGLAGLAEVADLLEKTLYTPVQVRAPLALLLLLLLLMMMMMICRALALPEAHRRSICVMLGHALLRAALMMLGGAGSC